MLLRDMDYVIAIAECLSFSKAAEQLYVTQPALSQAIQRLEEEMGVKLFRRDSVPLSLTPAGELFLEDAYSILRIADTIPKKMADVQHLRRGRLNIGISQFYGRYYMSRIIPEFQRKYPGIELHITEEISSVLEEMILRGKLDFCIFSLPISSSKLLYEPIFEEDILFAVPNTHPVNQTFTRKGGRHLPKVDLSLFAQDSFILIKHGQRMRTIATELCKRAGFTPKIAFETRSVETVNAFVASGMGVGFVPDALRKVSAAKREATYYSLKGLSTQRQFVAAYHEKGYLSAAAKTFIVFAKQLANHC